ncbi:MAG: ATP-binding protein [Pyrinomonadaceae bacterium]
MLKLPLVKEEKEQERPLRKPPWLLGGFVLILLAFLFILQSSNLWKTLTVDSASDTLLLYALSSLNFIAFVIFASIFARSLLKLRQERRALQIGSKIKTRLLVYFFAVSLLPLIAMAVFSYLFMNRALDRWFTQIPENVVRDVKDQATLDQERAFNKAVQMIATALEDQEVRNEDLQRIVDVGDFSHLEIISADSRVLATAEKPLPPEKVKELRKTLSYVYSNERDEPALSDGKGFDVSMVGMAEGMTLVAVADMHSIENLGELATKALRDFDDLKSKQGFVKQIGFTTLGLLTFLLIFAASWFALYVAKGLTRPIRALAEGADEITRGNLGYQVEVFAEDELDILVKAFNAMSAELDLNSDELKEGRRYIETVLQSLSTGVISFDGENRVTTINKAAVRMLKLENAGLLGAELQKLVNEENSAILRRLISRAKRIGQAAEQTTLSRTSDERSQEKDGQLPVALSATALPDENGTVVVIEDLSELIAAQRASAWREVARRMAHEIKNPLTPIQLSAERIAKRFAAQNGDGSADAERSIHVSVNPEATNLKVIKEGTDTILREVSSLKMMVNEFSRFARLPNVELETGDVNGVVRQAAALYDDRRSEVEITSQLGDKIPDIMIDEEQLKRVFVNLIDNAIEASDETQTPRNVTIKTYFDQARDIVVLEVSDDGKGIRPSDYQKLFQPYFSTKGRGTGLGLAIVQRIITEHGGKIVGVSNNPKGAKFIIELPTSN